MLIITRRPGERILLGSDVTIEVIETAGNNVRIGISAPRSLPIYREELWLSIKKENEAAARTSAERLPDALPAEPPARA